MNTADSTRLSSAGKQASVATAQTAVRHIPDPKQTESDFAMLENVLDQLSSIFMAIDDASEIGAGRMQQIRRLAKAGHHIAEDFSDCVSSLRVHYPAFCNEEVSHG